MINPVESLKAGSIVLDIESPSTTVADQIRLLCNPFIKAPSTIIKTESGYTVIIPPQNLGGPKIEVEQLGGGYYLVSKTPTYYGAQTQKIIMSEKEFIKEFNGFKTRLETDEKINKKRIIANDPYDYFRTKSGYVIKLLNGNNVTGATTDIEPQSDGSYLVISRAYPGAPEEKLYLSEQELIDKYDGEKIEVAEKMYNLVA